MTDEIPAGVFMEPEPEALPKRRRPPRITDNEPPELVAARERFDKVDRMYRKALYEWDDAARALAQLSTQHYGVKP
jgi:hypothetical protein